MKARSAAVSNVLLRIYAVVFTAMFFWALTLAVVQSAQNDYYLPLALAPVLTIVILLLWQKGRDLYHRIPDRILTIVFASCSAAAFFGMLYFSYRMRLRFGVDTWDFTRIQIDAAETALGEGGILLPYYAKYKNNQLLLLILTLLFKIVVWIRPEVAPETLHQWAMALNCTSIMTTTVLSFVTVKRQHNTHFAFLAGLFLLLYTPLWLYSPIYYTDTMGLPLIVLPVFLYTFVKEGKTARNIVLYCFMGVIAAIGMKMKASNVFVYIAIAIMTLLTRPARVRRAIILTGAAALVLVAFVLQLGMNRVLQITPEIYDRYQFPYSHWVMMSLSKNGGYDAQFVKYTASFETMDERKEGVAQKTEELLSERGLAGNIKHVFVTKMIHTWGNGSLSGTYYLGREPAENGVFQQYLTQKGDRFRISYTMIQTVHLMLLFGVALSGVNLYRRPRGGAITVMQVSIFGLLLFLLVWECNARYLVHIVPFLVMSAADGYASFGGSMSLQKSSKKYEKIS